MDWKKAAKVAGAAWALMAPVTAWAQGPTGIGALQIGLTKAQVSALPASGIHLATPLFVASKNKFASAPPSGETQFDTSVVTPWRSEPLKASLTFQDGKLVSISLHWLNDAMLMTTVASQISEKFGPPKDLDERRVESCPTYSGASEQISHGMLTRSWKQAMGKQVIVSGASTVTNDSCLSRREGKEPSEANMLLIFAADNVENPF